MYSLTRNSELNDTFDLHLKVTTEAVISAKPDITKHEKTIYFSSDSQVAVKKKARTFELSEKVPHIRLPDSEFCMSSESW